MNSSIAALDEQGFCILPHAVPPETVAELTRAIEVLGDSPAAGTRNLAAAAPAVARFAESIAITELLAGLGVTGAFLVRSLLFDKQPGANWKVAWHQDLTICVCEKRDVPGFHPWTEKGGIPHVQPPAQILERMITLRLHLDDCTAENGALRVLPGTHRDGVLDPAGIRHSRDTTPEVLCAIPRGGILAMRPLLLHASSQALHPRHRRVIHLEYAQDPLPGSLRWLPR